MTKNTTSINIDLEIYRLIENKRESFDETQNEILRRLLGLASPVKPIIDSGGISLRYSVFLPNGSRLKKVYKGKEYLAEVKDGYIWVNGKRYPSPSAAAVAVTGSPVNGWRWWEVKRPQDSEWISLDQLREKTIKDLAKKLLDSPSEKDN